ncbi:MAG: hypothetical protein AB8G77_08900 [Rhodothermales bacterium]
MLERTIFRSLLILCFYTPALCLAQEAPSILNTYQVYRFDAGDATSTPGTIQLTPADTYSEGTGYGWITAPEATFSRESLSRFRAAPLQDGVAGERIAFRADIPEGQWWMSLWMEAGLEDTNTARLSVNESPVPLGWNSFDAPAEPRAKIQKPYRVLHTSVDVKSDGLHFELIGQADSVRVLGFNLYPEPKKDASLLNRFREVGGYKTMLYEPARHTGSVFETLSNATDALEELRDELAASSGDDHFKAYWLDQLDLLIKAERLLAMRGWDWANDETGHSLFERIYQAIMIFDGILGRPDVSSYPFYERAMFGRGRLKYWLKVEGSSPSEIPGVRMPDLAKLHNMFPADSLFAMYNGTLIDQPDICDAALEQKEAPAWSQMQLETLCRLRDIAHWWVNDQQAPNGEFGGKFGDDVELLRWWPALILAGDTTVLAGWKKLADGVWLSGKIKDGYAKNVSDVEHASEFVSDTAPVMAMFTDDPVYTDRLRPSARHFENLWTGVNDAGHRHFKTAWFSSSEIDTAPPRNRDVSYNTRATKAIRYLAWKTGDPAVNKLMNDWSYAWHAAAMRTDKGKPAGIFPASVRYPDGAFNGDGDSWYEAGMFWRYFEWEHNGASMMLDQLLFSYTRTDDEALLEPMFAALSLIESNLKTATENIESGSPAWAADLLVQMPRFWSVVSQWRLYTGDRRFDELLKQYGTPYLRYRLTGNEEVLLTGLQEILDKVSYNTPLLTYEAIHTDRIYVTNSGSGSSHLKAMVSGDGVIEDMSPYPAVTWSDTDDTFTVLVADAGRTYLKAKLYSFSTQADELEARIWQLEPGMYKFTIQGDATNLEEHEVHIKERGQRIRFTLPGGSLITVSFDRMED